jgi:hypothetical protein
VACWFQIKKDLGVPRQRGNPDSRALEPAWCRGCLKAWVVSKTTESIRVMLRRRTLSMLIILSLLVGMLPVVVSLAADASCSEVAMDVGGISAHGCCAERSGHGQQPFCGDSPCPAGHCSLLSFLPSPDIFAHSLRSSADHAFSSGAYASHLSTPAIPPPIIGGLC